MRGLLPPLAISEALEVTKVYSVAGMLSRGQAQLAERPFRTPGSSVVDRTPDRARSRWHSTVFC
ncbi:MAG TPA: ATP-binding protein [Dehalococcoidia bacterium]|jgi:predicted ATPase with chaperone activity|nr:ATP-binding protein [Dehalococcoidia bacterium]